MANIRLGTQSNLGTNGSYDLLLVKTDNFPEGKVTYGFESSPRKITGVQKVAQLFIKLLLMTKGSDPLYPNRGTQFRPSLAGVNKTANNGALVAAIRSAISDAESQVKAAFSNVKEDPASRLKTVVVTGIDSQADTLNLYLKIITEAGEFAQVAVPFPELDLKLKE